MSLPASSITLGGIIDVTIPTPFGDIDLGSYGAQATLGINASQIGIQYNASVNSGTVSGSYGEVVTQNFTDPTGFNQTVLFDPANTSIAVNNPWFATTTPSVGATANYLVNLSGYVSGEVAYGFGSASGSANFGVNTSVPLAGYDSTSGFSLFGLPISNIFGIPSEPTLPYTTPIDFPLKPTPPPPFAYLQANLTASPTQSLLATLNVNVTPSPEEPSNSILDNLKGVATGYFTPQLAELLGTVEIDNPNLTLASGTAQADGSVSATSSAQLAAASMQLGALLAAVGLPGLSTETISFGGASISFTPASFLLTQALDEVQTASLSFTPTLTYHFTDSGGQTLLVPVTKDGVAQGNVSSISFNPNQDTVRISFTNQPITVTPTLSVQASLTNEIDLEATETGTLTILELSGSAFDQSFDFGPLFQQTYNLGMQKLATLAQTTFDVPGLTQTNVALPQFIIGNTIHPDLNVTQTTDDFIGDVPGTLSFAVASADLLAAGGVTSSTIYLGANTYTYVPPQPGNTGTVSSLVVNAGTNLTLQGLGFTILGVPETAIDAGGVNGLNNSVFSVLGTLNLSGVAVIRGNAAANDNAPLQGVNGLGGAISNLEGTVNLVNDDLEGNSAAFGGGAIYNEGILTMNGCTVSNNQSGAYGGGIDSETSLYISGCTFDANSTYGAPGASTNDNTGANGFDGMGGAVYGSGNINIVDSTFSGNSAYGGPGGGGAMLGGNGGNGYGGAICCNGLLTLINDTIVGNNAIGGNGGPGMAGDPLFSGASGTGSGGGVYSPGDQVDMANCIVAADTAAGGGPDVDIAGFVNFDCNLLGSNPSGVALPLPAGNLMGDPQLQQGADNGGPTENFLPAATSPAIGAGDPSVLDSAGPPVLGSTGFVTTPLLVDQRGEPRSSGGKVDIGADQYNYGLVVSGALTYDAATGSADLSYLVVNNGPEDAPPTTLTVPLPSGVLFASCSVGPGASETDPGVGKNGTVTVSLPAIPGGDSQQVSLVVEPTSASFVATAMVAALPGEAGPDDQSITTAALTLLSPNTGVAAPKVLYHFTDPDPNATPANFTAVVQWGDGSSNSSADHSGTVSVVANKSGGFDVVGSHLYSTAGTFSPTVSVQTPLMYAFKQAAGIIGLSGVLYQFNVDSPAVAADFTVSVSWGDGTSNTSSDGTGAVSVMADLTGIYPTGVFDVMGSHTYPARSGPFTGQVTVTGVGSSSSALVGADFSNVPPPLFFAAGLTGTAAVVTAAPLAGGAIPPPQAAQGVPIDDAAQLALAATCTCDIASVSGNGSGPVVVTAVGRLPATLVSGAAVTISGVSGFTGTANINGAFTVTVTSGRTFSLNGTATRAFKGSATRGTGMFAANTFALKPGQGSDFVPGENVSIGTQSFTISSTSPNQITTNDPVLNPIGDAVGTSVVSSNGALLLHFTDPNTLATAATYTVTVHWGDGTTTTSSDGTGTVRVVADARGGFDVFGSHTYPNVASGLTLDVQVQAPGGPLLDESVPMSVGNAPLLSSPGLGIADYPGDPKPASATLAGFTDTCQQESTPSDYIAIINWGDGTKTPGTIVATYTAATGSCSYAVQGSHTYKRAGQFQVQVTITHGTASTVASLQADIAAVNTSTTTGSLNTARSGETATLLPDDRVLVVGGSNKSGYLSSTELYNSTTGAWSTSARLNTARAHATATLLPNGQVLVAGGYNSSGDLASAEVYNPVTGAWSTTGGLSTARENATATLLPSGQVLVAGGMGSNGPLSSAELYNPATGTWSATGSLIMARANATATLLVNGQVLVVGGMGSNQGILSSAELYNPAAGTWSVTGSLTMARYNDTATLLPSGQVLVAGGIGTKGILSSAELYNPATATWSTTQSLTTARSSATATLLPNGRVFVAGGIGKSGVLSRAELYNPATGTWSATGSLITARANATATLLVNGQVLIAGGQNSSGYLSSTNLYEAATLRSIAVSPANSTLLVGQTQQYTAMGTYSDGSTQNITAQVRWSMTPSMTATILSTGLATAQAANTATVQAQLSGIAATTGLVVTATAATSPLEGPAAGSDSDIVSIGGPWVATSNSSWLHTSSSGSGFGVVTFSFDANAGATRTGTLTVGALTIPVTQAGSNYVAVSALIIPVSSGLNTPTGAAVDSAGNTYMADTLDNAVKEWNAQTGNVTTLVSSGLNNPAGVAVDGAGNVYIADSSDNAVKEWNAQTGHVTTLVSSGLRDPAAVAVDRAGNVYIADTANNAVKEWNSATAKVTTLVASGLLRPCGVAVDYDGNVYIADTGDQAIKEWNATTGRVITLVSSGLALPTGVAVDGGGNVFIADAGNKVIDEWSFLTQQVTTVVSGLALPTAVAVDFADNIYFTDASTNTFQVLVSALVPVNPMSEASAAGADALAVVLPTTQVLTGRFAPVSDQSWLTIGPAADGVIGFSFTANGTGAARTAHITLLGQSITVTQAAAGP